MIITRYLIKTTLVYIALAAFLLLGIDALLALARELKVVGQADYTLWTALQYVLLTLPRRLYDMFPMASLLGAMMGLGLLASHSELVAIRAAGFSSRRIALSAVMAALLLTIMMTAMGEWVLPKAEHLANVLRETARGKGQAIFTAKGAWLRDGDSFVYISDVLPNGHLENILRYDFDKSQRLLRAAVAKQAEFYDKQWHLLDVQVSHISQSEVSTQHLAETTWSSKIDEEVLGVLVRDPEDLSLRELKDYLDYLQENELESSKFELAFWQKMVQPLATLTMVFLAVPCILGPLRQATMGFRLVIGILLGFGFYLFNQLFGPLSLVYGVPALWGALLPTLLCAALALLLYERVR